MSKLIAYFRVSTKKQGASGLGLDGQKNAVAAYASQSSSKVVAHYVEIETGTSKRERPELADAISHCKLIGATLVVAKLDRLSRNVAFLSALMESGVDFVACDNPSANRLTLHVLAAVAENEAEAISQRTKAALQAAKERGIQLGSSRPGHWDGKEEKRLEGLAKGRESSLATRRAKAREKLAFLFPKLRELRSSGKSFGKIADHLNAEGFTTARGKSWTSTAVKRAYELTLED